MPMLECNTMAAKEHVSEAERMIWTIKDQAHGLIATLLFDHILQCLKIEFIYFFLSWLNTFSARNGMSGMHLARELLVRWKTDYNKHCRVLLGTYCKVYDKPTPSNTMTACTHKAIAVGPNRESTGECQVLLSDDGTNPKEMLVHSIAYAGQDDQARERNRSLQETGAGVPLPKLFTGAISVGRQSPQGQPRAPRATGGRSSLP
jgi:hypothetical protein